MTPSDHLLILDSAGICQWASASLVHALGFDPVRSGALRLRSADADGPEEASDLDLHADVFVRVEAPRGRRQWFTASGIRMGMDSGQQMTLLRLSEAPMDALARTALRLARQRDPATSLLTYQGLFDRLAHPAVALAEQPAIAILRAANAADTPWGPTLRHRDAIIGAMAEATRQAGSGHRFMARLSVDELGVVIDGLASWDQARSTCERLGLAVAESLAGARAWAGVEIHADALVPDADPARPWRLLRGDAA